jgi:hypothetical protein
VIAIAYSLVSVTNLEEAAAHARIDPERLADAESGTVALNSDELDRIAGSYGVDVTSFFGGRTTPLSYLFGA